jgi:hypothetical protein
MRGGDGVGSGAGSRVRSRMIVHWGSGCHVRRDAQADQGRGQFLEDAFHDCLQVEGFKFSCFRSAAEVLTTKGKGGQGKQKK